MSERFEPGSPAWERRVGKVLQEEAAEPLQWWYLSFATPEKFLGAAIVRARGMMTAMLEAHRLHINPGGEVMAFPVGDRPKHPVNQLLGKADLGPGGKTLRQLKNEGKLPGDHVRFYE